MEALDTTNPQHLIYNHSILIIAVLGGIRLEGLDRMRVTLKIQVDPSTGSGPIALRHNLDLYNDTQVDKLIRSTAAKLEVGTSVIAAALTGLTEELEQYRLEEIQRTEKQETITPLSEQERQAATDFLKTPNLMQRTGEMIGESGVIGEENNRLLMYLIFTSRKTTHPLHIVSLGASGIGKTHLQEKVGELIPQEDKIEITTLSENAFYYFERRALSHKLILIEDLDGAENVLYPLRELQSKKKISKTVVHKNTKGETRTISLEVEGPVSVAGCTTKESIYEDNANRSFLIYLDETLQQDERIMDYQRAVSAGRINYGEQQAAKTLLQHCQKMLQPVKVINPYAELLRLPTEVLKPRRTNAHYLAFIELVTWYHQLQRTEAVCRLTGEIYIETTIEDIGEANRLMKEVLLRKSDELTGACRSYFEKLKAWLKQENRTVFTNTTARAALKENHSNQKRYMLLLQREGMIRKTKGDKKKGFHYEVSDMPAYDQRRESINRILDDILLKITEVQSSEEVLPHSEPLKATTVKQSRKKSTMAANSITAL